MFSAYSQNKGVGLADLASSSEQGSGKLTADFLLSTKQQMDNYFPTCFWGS